MSGWKLLLVGLALVLGSSACGDDDSSDEPEPTTSTGGDPAQTSSAPTTVADDSSGSDTTEVDPGSGDEPESEAAPEVDVSAVHFDEAAIRGFFERYGYEVLPGEESDLAGSPIPGVCGEEPPEVVADRGSSRSWILEGTVLGAGSPEQQTVVTVETSMFHFEPGGVDDSILSRLTAVTDCQGFEVTSGGATLTFMPDFAAVGELNSVAEAFAPLSGEESFFVARAPEADVVFVHALIPRGDFIGHIEIFEGDPGSQGSWGGGSYVPEVVGEFIVGVDSAVSD